MPYTNQQIYDELQNIGSHVNRGFGQINKLLLALNEEPSERVSHAFFKGQLSKVAPSIHEDLISALIMLQLVEVRKDYVLILPSLRSYVQDMCAPHEWPVMRC